MPRRRSSPKIPSALDELGVSGSPELLLADNLASWEQAFRQDQTTTHQPFMALATVAAYWWLHEGGPPERVEVPWWALQAVIIGFQTYTTARDEGRTTTFGEAFGMESMGQGKQPRLAKERLKERNRDVALHIAMRIERGVSVESAIKEFAKQYDLGESTVWRAWSAYGDLAQRRLANFRTLSSS